jgi:hypothetical protein
LVNTDVLEPLLLPELLFPGLLEALSPGKSDEEDLREEKKVRESLIRSGNSRMLGRVISMTTWLRDGGYLRHGNGADIWDAY